MNNLEHPIPEQDQPLNFDLGSLSIARDSEKEKSIEVVAIAQCEQFMAEKYQETGQPILPSTDEHDPNESGGKIQEVYEAYFNALEQQGILQETDRALFARTFVYRYQMGFPNLVQ